MIQPSTQPEARRATLALGGGGARGLAHFGAYQAILEQGFTVERIVGTSMGAFAGAVLATHPPDEPLENCGQRVIDYLRSDAFRAQQREMGDASTWSTPGSDTGMLGWLNTIRSYIWSHAVIGRVMRSRALLGPEIIQQAVETLLPDIDIADTYVPLSIVTVDLKSGHRIVLEKGPLRAAIQASASIPGIFPPVEWDGMLLCDLGVLESLPAELAFAYASDLVIGVDVGPSLEPVADCESALHVLLRMDEIGERLFRRYARKFVDVLIRPDVGRFEWWDFRHPDLLFEAGLTAGRETLRRWLAAHTPSVPASEVDDFSWSGRLVGTLLPWRWSWGSRTAKIKNSN